MRWDYWGATSREQHSKPFVSLALVSSREKEVKAYAIEVQEEGIVDYGRKHSGVVDPIFHSVETSTKTEEPKKSGKLIRFAKKYAGGHHGLSFWKIEDQRGT